MGAYLPFYKRTVTTILVGTQNTALIYLAAKSVRDVLLPIPLRARITGTLYSVLPSAVDNGGRVGRSGC